MSFNKGESIFYKNSPCEFVCEINVSESVILIYNSFEGEFGSESIEQSIIVQTKYLSKFQINFDEEMKRARNESETMKTKAKNEAENFLREVRSKKEIELAEIEKQFNKIAAGAVVLKYLQGKIKYAVCGEYGPEIYELDSCFGESDRYKKPLKSLTIVRDKEYRQRLGDFVFRLDRYADGSGGGSRCAVFETLDEAKVEFIKIARECIKKGHYIPTTDLLNRWGIEEMDLLEAASNMKKRDHEKSIENLKNEIEKLTKRLGDLQK